MSGQVCKIIIEGNALIGAAQAVCELGSGTYDGVEIMTDEQQTFIASLMQKQVHDLRAFLKQFLPTGDAE